MKRIEIRGDASLLGTATLSYGSHLTLKDKKTCPRELLHLVVTGHKADLTPPCMTATLSAIPVLSDGLPSDEAREAVIRPFLWDLLRCPRDQEADQERAYALADYAVRVIAEVRCGKIVDQETAETAVHAATAAWMQSQTAETAISCSAAAAYSAADAADATANIADTARAARAAADAVEDAAVAASGAEVNVRPRRVDHTRALLQIIVAWAED